MDDDFGTKCINAILKQIRASIERERSISLSLLFMDTFSDSGNEKESYRTHSKHTEKAIEEYKNVQRDLENDWKALSMLNGNCQNTKSRENGKQNRVSSGIS